MKIYLLLIDRTRFFFYSEESQFSHDTDDVADPSRVPRSGALGWLRARYRRFKSAWQSADSGALLWMRRAWDWLHTWVHPDEAMLARLWSARRIDLHHPAVRPGAQVRAVWSDYLKKQWRRHLVWLIVNGVIAPFSLLFAILPGPNLIGYWFAYRAVHHLMVFWGIRRVRQDKVPTELHPIADLDRPIQRDSDGKISHSTLVGASTQLGEHMAWHSGARRSGAESEPSVPPIPRESKPANFPTQQF